MTVIQMVSSTFTTNTVLDKIHHTWSWWLLWCIHTYIYTHTHTYIHTYIQGSYQKSWAMSHNWQLCNIRRL